MENNNVLRFVLYVLAFGFIFSYRLKKNRSEVYVTKGFYYNKFLLKFLLYLIPIVMIYAIPNSIDIKLHLVLSISLIVMVIGIFYL